MLNNQREIRICLTGGSTGGHFFPLVFVVREFNKIAEERRLNLKFFYVGVKPFNEELLIKEGVKIYSLPSVKLRKYFTFENIVDLLKFPFVFFKAYYILFKLMPDVVFSKGGPSSLTVVLAAKLLFIPIFIHESDSYPGLTNRISGFLAKRIYLAFSEAKKYFKSSKVKVVGQPIDVENLNLSPVFEDYKRFELDPNRKIILILGGSQGSRFINDLIINSLLELLELGQIVHQTGISNYSETYFYARGVILEKNPGRLLDYHIFPFIDQKDLFILMKISDLIISRAGSSTIFEIAAVGKPSILIPIEEKVAGKHQILNALIYNQYGACKLLEEQNAKPYLLISLVKELFQNPNILSEMSKSALKFAKMGASSEIVNDLLSFLRLKI